MSTGSLISAFRPINLVMAAAIMLAVRHGLLGVPFLGLDASFWVFTLYTASVLCVMAFGYVVNDFFDVETDKENKPGRNIFENPNAVGQFLLFALPIKGCLLPVFINWMDWAQIPLYINTVSCVLLFIYARWGKNSILWGNGVVALLSTFLVYAAFAASKNQLVLTKQMSYWVGLYVLFSFLTTAVREIVKDAEDENGDRKAGIKTLATEYGVAASKKWAMAILILTQLLILACLWLLFHKIGLIQIAFVTLLLAGCLIIYKIGQAQHKTDFKNTSAWLKVYMCIGILTMLL